MIVFAKATLANGNETHIMQNETANLITKLKASVAAYRTAGK